MDHHEGQEEHEKKSLQYSMLSFKSFNNFMVKGQMLFLLS
jgi:hypothetical protein